MTVVLPEVLAAPRNLWRRFANWLHDRMPKGLYARALLIVILPVVLLQSAVAYVFMERHWEVVTYRLSAGMARQVAALVDIYQTFPDDPDHAQLRRIAAFDLNMEIAVLPKQDLPGPAPKSSLFSLLDKALTKELSRRLKEPFWINTALPGSLIEIRVALNDATLRMLATRTHAYASNSYIFFMWMAIASVIILAIATSFLRNQIRPILRLARAAEEFGKGRNVAFSPRGAREVRQAGAAFLDMKRRFERAIEQRTTMLNGVSHDLRTIITRFKLSLALMRDSHEAAEMRKDVDEMERMVEAYLAFARGDGDETSSPTDIAAILDELKADTEKRGLAASVKIEGDPNNRRAAGGDQAAARQPRRQCAALRQADRTLSDQRRRDDDRAYRRRRARHPRRASRGRFPAVLPARRIPQPERRKLRVWASPSHATSRAAMAGTSRSTAARSAACARRPVCRFRALPNHARAWG